MKICNKCKKEEALSYARVCKECKNIYDRKYWLTRSRESKDAKNARCSILRIRNRQFVYDFLLKNPCTTCGEKNPVLLEFDHIDPLNKKIEVSMLVGMGVSLSSLEKEINKCRVLCMRCHRLHTAKQLGWYKNIVQDPLYEV